MHESRGLFDPGEGLKYEIENYEMAIAEASRLCPDFVVVTGDLSHNNLDRSEIDEIKRVAAYLPSSIPVYWTTGNRELSYEGDTAEPELLKKYRKEFGRDYYSFTNKGVMFVTLSSTVIFDPSKVPGEYEKQLEFLEHALVDSVKQRDSKRIVFMHHPVFVEHPEEGDGRARLPASRRDQLLVLFRKYGVDAVFSGHLHRNNCTRDGSTLMITTTSTGLQAGDDVPGYRLVKVLAEGIQHEFYPLTKGPDRVSLD